MIWVYSRTVPREMYALRPSESLFQPHCTKALVLLAATCSPQAFGSDGIELTGVSFKARARGGVDVAVGDSALAQIDNPATLADDG